MEALIGLCGFQVPTRLCRRQKHSLFTVFALT
nr:MAG TPA: hypothetical protein [Caudoviricetes sp.]